MRIKVEIITKSPNGRELAITVLEHLFEHLGAKKIEHCTEEDGRYCLTIEATVPDVYRWHDKLTPFMVASQLKEDREELREHKKAA